jgi:type II secretory pathway pseudopilin PulG
MRIHTEFRSRILFLIVLTLAVGYSAFGGVSRPIQDQYKRDYENKAVFLKIPIYSEKQVVYINDQKIRSEQGMGAPRYKVGDQLRIVQIDFSSEDIKFKMSGITAAGIVEIIYKFDGNLQESFPNKEVFDRALQSSFTEGLKYSDIEDAKRVFVEQEFDRYVREVGVSASVNRETVLKSVAPRVPAYQDAQREIDNLKSNLRDVSGQLSQAQADNRKLGDNLKAQQAESKSLKNLNASLQEKIDNSSLQVSKLGEELQSTKGTAQDYQQGIANIQRSLNIRVESNRDLSAQISDLVQAARKLQKDNEALTNQLSSARVNLEAQKAANGRLLTDNEELKSNNKQMQSTINTLTSKGDSLAKRYVDLKDAKEKLDDFAQTVKALRARVVDEKNESGVRSGKANIFLKNILLGSLEWSLPLNINPGENKNGEVGFSAESIDYVRLTPEERHLLHTLGDKWKVRIDLASNSSMMDITPEKKETLHEIGERDHSTWIWKIGNQGSKDARILISARLINKNSEEVPFFQQENVLLASNLVRHVRGYLQPIPLAAGAVIGFLIFGIVGIFRKSKPSSNANPAEPPSYAGRKEL